LVQLIVMNEGDRLQVSLLRDFQNDTEFWLEFRISTFCCDSKLLKQTIFFGKDLDLCAILHFLTFYCKF
jgi:hypothetical protein